MTAPIIEAIQPIQLSPVPVPRAREVNAARRAPVMPKRIVTMIPPGSLPGMISFAIAPTIRRSEEHTSELQSLMRISYAVFGLKKKNNKEKHKRYTVKVHA